MTDFEEVTDVIINLSTASITVIRDRSTCDKNGVFTGPDSGSFTLFNILQSDGSIRIESLNVVMICDNSVLEVMVNGRFALSTRMYPTRGDAVGLSMKVVAVDGKSVEGEMRSCEVANGRT